MTKRPFSDTYDGDTVTSLDFVVASEAGSDVWRVPVTVTPLHEPLGGRTLRISKVCVALGLMLVCNSARAEAWPTLIDFVGECGLILLCENHVGKDENRGLYKVVETWKGTLDPAAFHDPAPAGFVRASFAHGLGETVLGQRMLFFYLPDDEGSYGPHSTCFVERDNKVVYASTSWEYRHEYTLNEFRAEVHQILYPWRRWYRAALASAAVVVIAAGGFLIVRRTRLTNACS